MFFMNRRALLGAVPSALLVGCSGAAVTPAQIVAQAQAMAAGLDGMLKSLAAASPTLIPAATLATLQGDLALAQAAAAALSASLPPASAASLVRTVEGYVNAVLNTLAGPPINGLIPAPFNMAVAAAAILLPQLEAFAALYIPAAAASPATAHARAAFVAVAPGLTPDAATAVLRGFAG